MKNKPCFCGKIPKSLNIVDNGQGMKWASAYCGECGEWSVEFRTGYKKLDSKECIEYAWDAWNNAPRYTDKPKKSAWNLCQELFFKCETLDKITEYFYGYRKNWQKYSRHALRDLFKLSEPEAIKILKEIQEELNVSDK